MAGEEPGGDPQEVGKSLPEITDPIDREKEAFCDNGMPLFLWALHGLSRVTSLTKSGKLIKKPF